MENEVQIEELIAKFLSGNCLPEEAMQLEDWKNASSENYALFEEYSKLYFVKSLEINQSTHEAEIWDKINSKTTSKPKTIPLKSYKTIYSIAASVLIGVLFFGLYTYFSNTQSVQNQFTANNTEQKFTLIDSSKTTIFPNSSIELLEGFNTKHRKIKMKGKAYFSVIHNQELPFSIEINKLLINDLGTKFLIDDAKNSDTIIVKVDEGIVELKNQKHESLVLAANQSAFYIKSTDKLIENKIVDSKNTLNFEFKNANLIDIVEQLSNAYHLKIELENNQLNQCALTTKFANEKIDVIVMIITETLGLDFIQTEKGYLIKGKKCN